MKEAEDPLYSSCIANCVFNAFSSYTAIMLNILTIHAMRKTSSLPKTLKTLLLSLAVSDLGVGLLVQPFYIAFLVKRLQQNTVDIATRSASDIIIANIFANASFFNVLAISVDRFLAIHLHLRYETLVTHKRVIAVVILIWVFSAFFSLIWWWIQHDITSLTPAVFVMIILGLCFISTTIIYFKIYLAVRRHTNNILALQVQVAQNSEMANVTRLTKSAVTTFYVYLVFLVCYLPTYCTFIAIVISGPSTTLYGFDLYTRTLVFLNSSLNPLVYCWKMRHIRQAVMDILRNIFPSQN